MKKILLSVIILCSLISFGQKKKVVVKPPSFKITYDKFENLYTYFAETGNIGIYATGTTKDFTEIDSMMLTLTVYDSYLTFADGIILLFADGTRMNIKTESEIGKSSGKGMWRYYVLGNLTEQQWSELNEKIIVSYKYYIFERNYKNGIQFKKLVNNFYE
jgi:hypothetical protein